MTESPQPQGVKQRKSYTRKIGSNPPGRPLKYTDEFIEAEAVALLAYAAEPATEERPIPFLKDFCVKRSYPSTYITTFAQNEKFFVALNRLKDSMEVKLVFGSLTNKLNSYMAMNTLKNVAGWRDKQEIEHSGEIKLINHIPEPEIVRDAVNAN